jgi:hypothetical protein
VPRLDLDREESEGGEKREWDRKLIDGGPYSLGISVIIIISIMIPY